MSRAGIVPQPSLSHYDVIGPSGIADVWLVEHRSLRSRHALKVLSAQGPAQRDRLLQEGRLQARLDHPNVVRVTDIVHLDDGRPGLIMEHLDGLPLDAAIARVRFNVDQVDDIARQILEGVVEAHALGLIHRELKPANVLLRIEPHRVSVKLTDFGLTRRTRIRGSYSNMAPEQFRHGRSADSRADVFSLGTVLYHLLTGARAFAEGDFRTAYRRARHGKYIPARKLARNAPESMLRAIEGALVPDREARTQTVARLLTVWCGDRHRCHDPWTPASVDRLESAQRDFNDVRGAPVHERALPSVLATPLSQGHLQPHPRTAHLGPGRTAMIALVAVILAGIQTLPNPTGEPESTSLRPVPRAPGTPNNATRPPHDQDDDGCVPHHAE